MRSRIIARSRIFAGAVAFATIAAGSMLNVGAASAIATVPAAVACPGCWHPALKTSWQWELSVLPTAAEISSNTLGMWDIDGFNNTAATVTALKARSSKVVCYISAGSYEGWRSDASTFPGSASLTTKTANSATLGILGAKMDGWNERWLDIRDVQKSVSPLANIMTARVQMCKTKGFDAIEFDNVDGYTNNTGFALTAADQKYYNVFLANAAHKVGLSAVLKNDVDQIGDLLPYFDVALNEECWAYGECTTAQLDAPGYDAFVAAGKAVFGVEYVGSTSTFCPKANAQNFNWLKKTLALDSTGTACR